MKFLNEKMLPEFEGIGRTFREVFDDNASSPVLQPVIDAAKGIFDFSVKAGTPRSSAPS